MALQDLERGNGFALIDPHGDLVDRINQRVPESRRDNVIYLSAGNPGQPYSYNPLRHVSEDRIALAASGLIEVFKKMWPEAWGVRMEHILRNVLMALLEQPSATLHDVLRMLSDRDFRKGVAKSLQNEAVRAFLLKEFDGFSFGYRADGTAPIQNKVGAFLADPLLNRILTAPKIDLHRLLLLGSPWAVPEARAISLAPGSLPRPWSHRGTVLAGDLTAAGLLLGKLKKSFGTTSPVTSMILCMI
jgi:hypothetical protein